MKRGVILLFAVLAVFPLSAWAQIVPPGPGVELPQAYLDRIKEDRTAFQFQRAWLEKARLIKANREAYVEERGFYNRQLLSPAMKADLAVTGTFSIPVFCVKYSNTGSDPYATSVLQTKLFTGPFAPQTLTQYYSEISYGDLTVTGTVYGWHQLPNLDTYYEGPSGCYGLCATGKMGQLILSTLNGNDASVNFALYDNDGPDGVPNSGDDDGYVDVVAFVQPEVGAECGSNNNIWSHRWVLSGWTGSAWTSNDASANGGFIKVDDYTIQPARNCGGATPIDIGVFCHEFGHAFGLPDLYDTNGGSSGIGHWGLMGSGSWNTTTQPSHMCAWSKGELGWTSLVEIGTPLSSYSIANVEYNRAVYRANVMNERWRRMTDCAISGTSMRCGLRAAEATARAWGGGEGYGNGWQETVSREFYFDGTTPVSLAYDYKYDTEPAYDFTYGKIDVGGVVSTFASYDGTGSGHAVIDLTPYLTGSPPTTYAVSFEFFSDMAWSDEDNSYPTTCGSFVFDNVTLTGGGESYFTDFETREDGWWVDMAAPSEYFLLENRQSLGSDVAVHGGGGLAIWHIDDDVARSTYGNTGGPSGTNPRGVALEQADGLFNLENNNNRGDAGDPYPGSTNNMLFSSVTTPNSVSYNGTPSNVYVNLTTGNGDPIGVSARGSWFPPTYTSHNPLSENNDKVIALNVWGGGFVKGCTVALIDGSTVLSSSTVGWIGKDYIIAAIDLNAAPAGDYDVVVTNPGGGTAVQVDGFHINDVISGTEEFPRVPAEFALRQNFPNPFNPSTTIPFDIRERTEATLRIYNIRGQLVRTLVDRVLEARSYTQPWDGRDDGGVSVSSGVYFCKLVAGDFEDVRKLVLTK